MKNKLNKYILKQLTIKNQSQASLARYLGISRQSLGFKIRRDSWETKDLSKVAEFLDMTLTELIAQSGQR